MALNPREPRVRGLPRLIRRNALGLVLVTTFLVIWLVGQTTTGLHLYNQQRQEAGLATVGWSAYLRSAHFGEATFENWERSSSRWRCSSC
jgi:hypothetical protein